MWRGFTTHIRVYLLDRNVFLRKGWGNIVFLKKYPYKKYVVVIKYNIHFRHIPVRVESPCCNIRQLVKMQALPYCVHIFLIKSPYKICIIKKVEIENNSFFSCISRKNVYRHIISTGCNIIQQSGKAFPHVINILLLIK